MTAAQLNAFVAGVIGAYQANTTNYRYPTHFVIPARDYAGLMVPFPGTVGTFPVPILEYLEKAFQKATMNPEFKILPCAYCEAAVNNTLRGLNKNIYMLYRHDPESLLMNVPLTYTASQPGTADNFSFADVAISQFTGVGAIRPLELFQMQY